jgi:choline dehydrogenase-like flavoprotein
MKGLRSKVAVVTGCSSGIGQAIAIRLGHEGVDVAINYVGRREGAEETQETIERGLDVCMKQVSEAGTRPYPSGAMQMLGESDAVLIGFDVPDASDPADVAWHSIDFWLTTEDLPLPENQVTLGPDSDIRLSSVPTNLEANQRLREMLMTLLDTMRCRDGLYENRQYSGGRLGIGGVAHQNETIRFGADPTTSALDPDCKLHELDNVRVADSRFFASATAVNPTLTIIANAPRVADNVTRRMGRTTFQAQPANQVLPLDTGVGK